MKHRYKIIEYEDGHCHVMEKGWFFWSYVDQWYGWESFSRKWFNSRKDAETYVQKVISGKTIKKVTRHP
jgi:hypothetical protein